MHCLVREPRFVVIDKPGAISVHRGWDASRDTILSRLRSDLGQWVYPVHRLDRATSGALIVALDPETASILAASFRDGTVQKEYLALARGPIDAPIVVDHPIPIESGERVDAVTEIEPIAIARERYSLIRVRPRTGRPHQIRRHLKHLSRHLLGDTTYGDGRENRKMREEIGLPRMALHASRIAFPDPYHPTRTIDARAPLPDDLRGPFATLGFDPALLATL